MRHAFLIKYAEIGIKGKNRGMFEDSLIRDIRRHLRRAGGHYDVTKEFGRIYVFPDENDPEYDREEAVEALRTVFGISGICPVVVMADEGFEKLAEQVTDYMKEK
ncbi:MAG: tRNA 4-thiouridine(8) synthase ThiI, partial [Eubacterium sp.]|nr:tRNA 4-thiouridine(8) synthase ThiI [Eubacterium sp.]